MIQRNADHEGWGGKFLKNKHKNYIFFYHKKGLSQINFRAKFLLSKSREPKIDQPN